MTRKELANAIRALSMDAVQKLTLATPAHQWGWPISPKCCGTISCAITRPIPPGTIVTGLFCPMATPQCCFTACCIFPATTCRSKS